MRIANYKTIGTLVAVAISLLILFFAADSLLRLDGQSRIAGQEIAVEAIEKSVMQCYALEGSYPPNLEYLEQNYGLILDRDKYVYQYDIIAGNIHPIIGIQLPGGGE